VALQGTIFENCLTSGGNLNLRTLILVWDTGALFWITSLCSVFIDYMECDIPMRDITKVNKVIGIGTRVHKFANTYGNPVFLPCVSYHLPQTDMFVPFPLKPTIRCMGAIQRFTVSVFR
jgi:hypothetical protein